MHILMLLSNAYTHDPRVRNEVRSLTGAGHRVTVVAWDRLAERPAEEGLDGARIVRVRSTRWMRALGLDILRLRGWWRASEAAALRVHDASPVQAIHAHDLDTLPAGVRLKRRLHVPLVYDAHEIWGHMIARDLPWPVPEWFFRKERHLVRQVDHVISVNDILREHFALIAPDKPFTLVQNARPLASLSYGPPEEPVLTVLYIGRLNAARFILPAIAALSDLERVQIVIGGIGKPDYVSRVEAAARAAANVSFLGRVPTEEVMALTRRSHVVLHMIDPRDRNNRIATGNKQFEAMAAGRPIIATEGTNDGEVARREGHGLVIPFDGQALRAAVSRLRDEPGLVERLGRRALDAAKREYNWEAQERRLLGLYAHLAER